jgi:hypothetical protein
MSGRPRVASWSKVQLEPQCDSPRPSIRLVDEASLGTFRHEFGAAQFETPARVGANRPYRRPWVCHRGSGAQHPPLSIAGRPLTFVQALPTQPCDFDAHAGTDFETSGSRHDASARVERAKGERSASRRRTGRRLAVKEGRVEFQAKLGKRGRHRGQPPSDSRSQGRQCARIEHREDAGRKADGPSRRWRERGPLGAGPLEGCGLALSEGGCRRGEGGDSRHGDGASRRNRNTRCGAGDRRHRGRGRRRRGGRAGRGNRGWDDGRACNPGSRPRIFGNRPRGRLRHPFRRAIYRRRLRIDGERQRKNQGRCVRQRAARFRADRPMPRALRAGRSEIHTPLPRLLLLDLGMRP